MFSARSGGLAACLVLALAVHSALAEDLPKPPLEKPDAVARQLDQPVEVHFDDVPLGEAIAVLSKKSGVPMVFDQWAVNDEGISFDTPVKLSSFSTPLRKALDRLCQPLGLTWLRQDEMLLITTETAAGQRLEVRVYDVSDLHKLEVAEQRLLEPDLLEEQLSRDYHALIDLITGSIPGAWDHTGGPGSIAPFRESLVVSQTAENHGKVAVLLGKVRETLRRREAKQASVAPLPWNETMAKKLAEPSLVQFRATPLSDVTNYLMEYHKIVFWIDAKRLSDEGVSPDVPVTIDLKQVRLSRVLEQILNPLNLTYLVDGDEIVVTTRTAADQSRYAEVYDVFDLAMVEDEKGISYDFDRLLDIVTSSIAPTSWEGSGPGPGAVYLGMATWQQSQDVHRQIAQLLNDLRKTRASQKPAAPAVPADPNALVVRVYPLNWSLETPARPDAAAAALREQPPGAAASGGQGSDQSPRSETANHAEARLQPAAGAMRYTEEVGKAVIELIEPNTWQGQGGDGSLRVIPSNRPGVAGTLVVRQTRAVHKQIDKLLLDLQATGGFY
jgi:type II secretory pathway component GspD/PulD (secretin)